MSPSPGISRVAGRGYCFCKTDALIAVQSCCHGLTLRHSGEMPAAYGPRRLQIYAPNALNPNENIPMA